MTAKELLGFHYSGQLALLGKNFVSEDCKNKIQNHIKRINEIKDELPEPNDNIDPLTASVVYNKFIEGETLERRDIRLLSGLLSYAPENQQPIFNDEELLKKAVQLFKNNWRDTFLSGLTRTILKEWRNNNTNCFNHLFKFVKDKSNNYNGSRKSISAFKDNQRYFDRRNGCSLLANDLFLKKKTFSDIESFCGMPNHWLANGYFIDVIISYYRLLLEKSSDPIEKKVKKIITECGDLFQRHTHRLTKQVIISSIINKIVNKVSPEFQKYVQKEAFKIVGDPASRDAWRPDEEASDKEKNAIEQAKKILNDWISRDFIKVFFEICIRDEERQKFWLNIVENHSMSFKVVGAYTVRNRLKQIESISEYVESRFKTTQTDTSVTALVMYIGNYMIIEFARIGHALYAYKENGNYTPNLDGSIRNQEALKNSNIGNINLDNIQERDEGRMTHNGEWKPRFHTWLKQFVFKN